MSQKPLQNMMHLLRRAVQSERASGVTDSELLEDFVQRHNEAAFELLVWRNSARVLGVCRRLLRDAHEAEDAFQATFLVFIRKAKSIRKRDSVGSWLYKVAFRIAQRARARAAKRPCHTLIGDDVPAPAGSDETQWRDLGPVLEEEVNGLPEKYRRPFILCYLEGNTNDEAARQIGCPKGTILSRLSRGRERLQGRLARRGIVLSAGALAMFLSQHAAEATTPAALVNATVKAAIGFAAGNAAAGLVSARAAAWTEGVLKAMFMTKLKITAVVLMLLGLAGTGTGLLVQPLLADPAGARKASDRPATAGGARADQPGARGAGRVDVHGIVKSVDADKGTLTVTVGAMGRGEAIEPKETTFTVAPTTEVAINLSTGRRFASLREGKLANLAHGTLVVIRLTEDQKTVESIVAEGPSIRGIIKTVEADKNAITITQQSLRRDGAGRGEAAAEESKTYTVAPKAELAIDDGRGKTFSLKEAKLTDLPHGALVSIKLSVDQKAIQSLLAEGPVVQGIVKSVAADKKTLTLGGRAAGRGGENAEGDQTYDIGPDIDVLFDDGKGRLLSVKDGNLSDLPVGAVVSMKLSVDKKTVMSLRAEGPSIQGQVKSIDAGKGAITLVGRKGRGDTPAEDGKTYTIAKDARILIDGKEGKLADLKPGDDGPQVSLKLSLDQKEVQSLVVGGGRGR